MSAVNMLELYRELGGKSCFHAEVEMKPQDVFPWDKFMSMPGIDKVILLV